MPPFPLGQSLSPEGQGRAGSRKKSSQPPQAHRDSLTIIQRPLQDGRVAGAAVPDAREGQHLDLVEHVFAQARELGAA